MNTLKIYTASSWKNQYYPLIVDKLIKEGYQVYDFRTAISTIGHKEAFDWVQVSKDWENWTTSEFIFHLHDALCVNAFNSDLKGMQESDICLLILPSGKSSHIEAGYMKGLGKKLFIFAPDNTRPELTYSLADNIFIKFQDLLDALKRLVFI